jgi:type IV secretory pathway VirB10-like protein
MMRRRVGRPGLVGTMARTAVVAGTATAVAGGVSSRQHAKAAGAAADQQADAQQAAQMADMQAQIDQMQTPQAAQAAAPPPPPPPPPAAAASTGLTAEAMTQLQQLGELKQQGILTEEEFAASKAKLLGI